MTETASISLGRQCRKGDCFPPHTSVRERFAAADGPCKLEGAVFEIDPATGKCVGAEAIRIED